MQKLAGNEILLTSDAPPKLVELKRNIFSTNLRSTKQGGADLSRQDEAKVGRGNIFTTVSSNSRRKMISSL